MKKYETVVVYDGVLPEEIIAQEQKKVTDFLSSKGTIVSNDVWGKRELAYSINKRKTGFYSLFTFEYDGNATDLVDTFLRYNENVIRHLTVVQNDAPITPKKVDTSVEGDK